MRSRVTVCSENRLLLITGGRLCAMLARRLLCFNGECAVRDALRLGTSALSRRHFFRNSSATCVATLAGHIDYVHSVAFHPTAPLLATGSLDKTVRLWLLSSDNSSATCVATLAGHSSSVLSVAFHPTAPLLATGSSDCTVRLWLLSSDNSSATCVATLEGHSSYVLSVAFHPTAPLLATGSDDSTVRLWR
jgi:WD40 repeat protein